MLLLIGLVALSVLIYMSLWFWYSMQQHNLSLVDIAWATGFFSISLGLLLISQKNWLQYLVAFLVSIWSIRLAALLVKRRLNKPEDERYTQIRKKWKTNIALNAYFRIFILQGVFMVLVAMPIIVAAANDSVIFNPLSIIGIVIWLFGFTFEIIADYQLQRFTEDRSNKGKIMDKGLWSLSRHPNYFGEVTVWWGLWLIVLPYSYGWLALLSPLTITILILFVSGVPILEKRHQNRPGYAEYAQKTNKFIPLPKRR